MKPIILLFVFSMIIPVFAQESTLNYTQNQLDNQINQENLERLEQRVSEVESQNNISILENIQQYQEHSNDLTWIGIILAIIGIGTSSGAFIFAYKGDREIKNLIGKLGLDLKNIITSNNVKFETSQIGSYTSNSEIKTNLQFQSQEKKKIVSLLERLPDEKLSTALHQAKLIALELKDKEMEEWIQNELDGYQSIRNDEQKEKKLQKNPPENRMISGHFYIGSTLPDVRPVKITRRVFINQPIAQVEDTVEKHKSSKIQTTLPYKIENTGTQMDGETMDLLLPAEEWNSVLIKTQQKLSKYLESHLFNK